jgi:myosin-1
LTLKTEQEEYLAQEIEWTGVKYFDNQVICDLIETKPTGILSLLNEETTMPGEPTDLTFLEKLDTFLIKNDYYDSFTKNKNDKQLVPGMFRIKHYAGDVNYNVQNFLEKNRDELYKDLVTCMSKSKSKMIAQMFVQEDINNAKRPETLATQVRQSINTLLAAIKQKNPHYIRCIRPNSHKCAKNFDLDYVGDQWRYLGLQENIHVKRAGFCFRQEYTTFLYQFKMLAKETWPFYKGTSQTGVQLILNAMKIPSMEYAFGKSMIFIKSPQSVRKLEASRLATKHLLTTKIQRMWKSYAIRRTYKRLIKCSIQIQAWYRMCQSRQEYTKKQNAAKIITKIYRGHLARKNVKKLMSKLPRFAAVTIQKSYRKYVVRKFLKDLKHDVKRAGAKWVSIKWPSVSQPLQEASDHLFKIYRQLKATQVCKPLLTSPVLHAAIRMKISAYNLFSQKASIKKR